MENQMMSVNLQKAYDKMMEIGKSLTAYDFKGDSWVYVRHEDGTEFRFSSAFAYKLKIEDEDFLIVFTEHNGYHAFSIGDLDEDAQFGGYYSYEMKFIETPHYK